MKEHELEVLKLIYKACKYELGVKPKDELTRVREAVQARQLTIYIASKHKHLKKFSLNTIGKALSQIIGRKKPFDHATVIHAKKTIEIYLDSQDSLSKAFAGQVANVIAACEKGKILERRWYSNVITKIEDLQKRIAIAEKKKYIKHLRTNHLRIRL